MDLDSTLMLTELGPPEHIQAQGYGRGIESIDVTVRLEDVHCPLTSGLTDEVVGIFLEDAIVAIGVGLCKITSCYVLAQTEMIAFLIMCLDSAYQVSQTLAIAQLTKH